MNALLAQLDRVPSCPLRKALIMLFRGELSERIGLARTVTENNDYLTLFENGLRVDRRKLNNALLAQLDRASVYGTEG